MLMEERKQLKIKDDQKFQHLYCFLKDAFKEGLVRGDAEDLKKCFSYDAKDKSLYFYQQGETKDQDLMLIFYHYYCFIPLKYRRHLRNEGPCNMHILRLNYQKVLAEHFFEEVEDLSILFEIVEKTHNIGDSPSRYKDIFSRPDGATIFRSFTDFEKTHAKVHSFIKRKLKVIKSAIEEKKPSRQESLDKFKRETLRKLWAQKEEEIKRRENNWQRDNF